MTDPASQQTSRSRLRQAIKLCVPPIVLLLLRRMKRPAPQFIGPFSSWLAAPVESRGWEEQNLLARTLKLALAVRDGDVAYQYDGFAFEQIVYSETVLAFLALGAQLNASAIDVLDVGGSLGTNFEQNRKLLRPYIDAGKCRWTVLEVPETARLGAAHLATESLRFVGDIGDVAGPTPCVLFSGSLQYLEQPLAIIDRLIAMGAALIAFDRVFVGEGPAHRVFVHQPPQDTYPGVAWRVWHFSRRCLVAEMAERGFELVETFRGDGAADGIASCGMIFRRPLKPDVAAQ